MKQIYLRQDEDWCELDPGYFEVFCMEGYCIAYLVGHPTFQASYIPYTWFENLNPEREDQ